MTALAHLDTFENNTIDVSRVEWLRQKWTAVRQDFIAKHPDRRFIARMDELLGTQDHLTPIECDCDDGFDPDTGDLCVDCGGEDVLG